MPLVADDPGTHQSGQLLEVPAFGISQDHVIGSAGHGCAAWWPWRASTVTGLSGTSPRRAATVAKPMMPAPTTRTGSPFDRWCSQESVTGDGERLVQAGCAVGDGVGKGMEHGGMRHHLVAPSAAQALGEAERAAGGEHPAVEVEARRGPSSGAVGAERIDAPDRAGDARVDGDALSDRLTGTADLISTTRPAISCPSTKGIAPIDARVGDGPVLCAKRCRSLPQMPPVVTATRAQSPPGSSGSATSTSDAGNDLSTMSNWTARTAESVGGRGTAPLWWSA